VGFIGRLETRRFQTDLVDGRRAAVSQWVAPWNLYNFRARPYAVACTMQQRLVLSC
jgi:hypothetical protein